MSFDGSRLLESCEMLKQNLQRVVDPRPANAILHSVMSMLAHVGMWVAAALNLKRRS